MAVSIASYMEIPVSTTQCVVGATAGCGLVSGGPKAVDWWQLLKVAFSWVCVFLVAVVFNAAFFSFCAYGPSLASDPNPLPAV